MAGASGRSSQTDERMGRAGLIWNEAAGGYVDGRTTNPKTGRPYNAAAGGTWKDESGTTWTPNNTGGWTGTNTGGGAAGSGGGYGGGGGGAPRGGAPSGGGGGNADEIRRLIEEIRRGSTPYTPEQATPHTTGNKDSPYDQDAERAAYGASKERTGMAAQSALRALREQLNTRGMTGGGLEAEMTGGILRGGLGELADTDRQLAERRSGRAYESENRNVDRLNEMERFNAGLRDKAVSGRPSYDLSRWSLLAQLAGMY